MTSPEILTTTKANDYLPPFRKKVMARTRRLRRVFGSLLAGKLCRLASRIGIFKDAPRTYYVLKRDPLIIFLSNQMQHTFEIAELFSDRRVHFIKGFSHSHESPAAIRSLTDADRLFKALYPSHSLQYICNSREEVRLLKESGVHSCHFVNKNAFADENMYTVSKSSIKQFDAVYNARLHPWKRHELARELKSLALITYLHPSEYAQAHVREYGKTVHQLLKTATWFNDIGHPIAPARIGDYLNLAHVGLCLSAEEGQMGASIEYLLCGLPIVSTSSIGGRDAMFDPSYAKIVEDDPFAIADAVAETISEHKNPLRVREMAIDIMQPHRQRFIRVVNDILEADGQRPDFGERWNSLFVNKLRTEAPFPSALLIHTATGMPVELCRQIANGI